MSAEYKELEAFRNNVARLLNNENKDAFMGSCVKELAARLLAKVIKRTPVGVYPAASGQKGGTLRRGWTAGKSAASFLQSLSVRKEGGAYVITIENPTEYASYVEYGHRTRDHAGWVSGKFMLTVSENEVGAIAPALLEKKLQAWLKEMYK